ncbi:DUF2407 C-terminal domain-containing protein [Xylariaceae sp. FL0016]|nr:DUF2407 C-terminal domain-containing protein [Xylariaceae sp. FL0016]
MTSPSALKPPAPSTLPNTPPLLLTIRFSAAIPDLELDIPHPSTTTVVSLKHLIRGRLEEPNSQRRLRFIHGGKILPDNAVLSSVLRPLPPPPPRASAPFSHAASKGDVDDDDNSDARGGTAGKGKGKGKSIPGREPPPRIYTHCSIGDSLTTAELEAEAAAALLPPQTQPPLSPGLNSPSPSPYPSHTPGTPGAIPSAPRGFDRLLATGFTATEVHQLRLQFRSIHSSRYTPDTLPSPDGFRRMEDAWIDDNSSALPLHSGGGAAGGVAGAGGALGMSGGGTDSDEVGEVAMIDVLIRGVIVGFVWPLGSAGWLIREQGMTSGRWRFMVGVGVAFAMLIGVIRTISGGDR